MQADLKEKTQSAGAAVMQNDDGKIAEALRRYWGYGGFRPGQEEIVRRIVAGCDACVVMPTGGGKSLCYQLPAALAEGRTAVVISPLIALMQDQVAHLSQMGIPAVFLNSAVAAGERREVKRRAAAGEYRLLYLSPERVVLDGTAEWLKRVPVSFFAIDEAHCISEWGHDFRPEYRQLNKLRDMFPEQPIAAFTASATQRVRHDIIEQLRLREPYKHIASFRRPNLRYLVKECDGRTQEELLLRAVRRVPEGSVIVYAPTIARVGEIVDFLEENGFAAVGYHGQMESVARRENQEKWMADEVRVIVGTLAFGLGINKASVRVVIHLSLPKSVEQYYQEAGRAGRDELPADCLLLWRKKDIGLHIYFIEQIGDSAEHARAWQRHREVLRFAEAQECRQRLMCIHFGEAPKWQSCGECDACGGLPDWMHVPAERGRKKRLRQRSGTHERSSGGTQPAQVPAAESALREYLREWRRNTARDKGVSAFIVMHDTTLADVASARPSNMEELMEVPGIGEKKAEIYGEEILAALERFRRGERGHADWHAKASQPVEETLRLLEEGRTFEEIAQIRGRKVQTVVALVAELIESGDVEFLAEWLAPARYDQIKEACARVGTERLRAVKDALPAEVSYDEIRLVVAKLRAEDLMKLL